MIETSDFLIIGGGIAGTGAAARLAPEAKVTVSDDKKSYEWEGKKVGSGVMKITDEKKNKSIYIDLTFNQCGDNLCIIFIGSYVERSPQYFNGLIP